MTHNEDTETLVCADIKARQQMGIDKYKTTVAKNPLELKQWLQHAYEETLDKAIYLKRAMQDLDVIVNTNIANSVDISTIAQRTMEMMATRFGGPTK